MSTTLGRRLARWAWVTSFAVALGFASAEWSTVGTVEGTVDGEAKTWYVVEFENEDGVQAFAYLYEFMTVPTSMYTFEVQASQAERFRTEGTLFFSGVVGPLTDCPCEVMEPEFMYFSGPSMFDGVYEGLEGTLVLDVAEEVAPGVYRLQGSFRALLGLSDESTGHEPDPERTVVVEGAFSVERVREDE